MLWIIVTLLTLSCKFDCCTDYLNSILSIPSSALFLNHGAPIIPRRCSSPAAGYSKKCYCYAFTSPDLLKEHMLAHVGAKRRSKTRLSSSTWNHVIQDKQHWWHSHVSENFQRINTQLQKKQRLSSSFSWDNKNILATCQWDQKLNYSWILWRKRSIFKQRGIAAGRRWRNHSCHSKWWIRSMVRWSVILARRVLCRTRVSYFKMQSVFNHTGHWTIIHTKLFWISIS